VLLQGTDWRSAKNPTHITTYGHLLFSPGTIAWNMYQVSGLAHCNDFATLLKQICHIFFALHFALSGETI
jgi:hypothetical protein